LPQGVLFHSGKEAEMRQQLIDTDMIECVITLVQGVFFSTGVSACILLLNKNKDKAHKNKICMIDASKIYTAKRAQNIMTEENIQEVFSLYQNYENVVEKCQIVSLSDIKDTLVTKTYIQKKEVAKIDPKEVKRNYMTAYQAVIESEEKLQRLLQEGGYINE
jgi:type I restriction enzyme M protein